MPIIDLGYRKWDGERSSRYFRPLVITAAGLRLVWRAVWLRRLMIVAWLPAIPTGVAFFAYEQSLLDPRMQDAAANMLRVIGYDALARQLLADPQTARHGIWSVILLAFFRHPQAIMIVVLFGLVAPRMISYDMRSRAHLMYFSRPLTVGEYLLGKALVLVILLILTTTIPALGVYVLGLLLSPDTSTILQTYDLPLRVLASSAVLAIPTASLAILYSSFTTESRYASFAWFVTWVLGWVTYATLTSSELLRQGTLLSVSPNVHLVSPYHALGQIQAAIFGVLPNLSDALAAAMLTAVVTVFATLIAYQRVASQIRV